METTKKVLNLEETQIKYLTNGLGEKNCEVSQVAYDWYCNIKETEFLHYLVEMNGEEGLLAILEVSNPDSETWEDAKQYLSTEKQTMSSEAIFADLQAKAFAANEQIQNTIILGENMGIYDTHEFGIFFPVGLNESVVFEELQKVIQLF